jgi:hypothetical protein
MVRYKLGCVLANLPYGSEEQISLLRKALELLAQSANAGYQRAKENLPIVQNNLARAYKCSARINRINPP